MPPRNTAAVRRRRNLVIRGGAEAGSIIIKKKRATGVQLVSAEVLSAGEVILAASTLGSPAILMRSGIGPYKHLSDIGSFPVLVLFRREPGRCIAPSPPRKRMLDMFAGDLTRARYMYIHLDMRTGTPEKQRTEALFDLPCACQNLRRATRVVTRIYDQELTKAGIEITQFGLLTALALAGEVNQKRLSAGFAMDSTTLSRTLNLMLKQGWIRARRGKDKRERLFSLTHSGRRQLEVAQPFWEAAQRRLRIGLGDVGWKNMKQAVSQMTEAALAP